MAGARQSRGQEEQLQEFHPRAKSGGSMGEEGRRELLKMRDKLYSSEVERDGSKLSAGQFGGNPVISEFKRKIPEIQTRPEELEQESAQSENSPLRKSPRQEAILNSKSRASSQ